jgi:hypothetical protein
VAVAETSLVAVYLEVRAAVLDVVELVELVQQMKVITAHQFLDLVVAVVLVVVALLA